MAAPPHPPWVAQIGLVKVGSPTLPSQQLFVPGISSQNREALSHGQIRGSPQNGMFPPFKQRYPERNTPPQCIWLRGHAQATAVQKHGQHDATWDLAKKNKNGSLEKTRHGFFQALEEIAEDCAEGVPSCIIPQRQSRTCSLSL